MSKRKLTVRDLDFQSFNFANPLRVDTALTLLTEEIAVEFLTYMKANFPTEFISLILRNPSSATLIAKHQKEIVSDGVVALLTMTRLVVDNASIGNSSMRAMAVSDFKPEEMTGFITAACKQTFPDRTQLGKIKVLVVIESENQGRQVARLLNSFGYAFFKKQAITNATRTFLSVMEHWPIFVVQPAVCSGRFFGQTDLVFLFKTCNDISETISLEIRLASEGCLKTFVVFPKSSFGLKSLVEHYFAVKKVLPIRV